MKLGEALDNLEKALSDVIMSTHEIDPSDLSTLCRAYGLIKRDKERLDISVEGLTSLYHDLSYNIIPQAMELNGFQQVKVDDRLFTVATRLNATIPDNKREFGHKWLAEVANVPALIREAVNSRQLSSFVKSYIETHGKLPPDEAITVHMQQYTQVRRV